MQAFLARHARAPWYPAARSTWDEWTERVLAAEGSTEVEGTMAEVLPLYTAHPNRPGVQAMLDELRRDLKIDLAAMNVWESGLWQRIDVRPLLPKIRCPTLVLVGALDMICGPAQGQMIVEAMPERSHRRFASGAAAPRIGDYHWVRPGKAASNRAADCCFVDAPARSGRLLEGPASADEQTPRTPRPLLVPCRGGSAVDLASASSHVDAGSAGATQ